MNPRPPFVPRRTAFIGDPVMAADVPDSSREAMRALKDWRQANIIAAHHGFPDRLLSLDNSREARWHLCLPGEARPDAATEDRRRYAIQMIPWTLQTGHLGAARYIEWVEDVPGGAPAVTVQSSNYYGQIADTTAATAFVSLSSLETWSRTVTADIIGAVPPGAGAFRHARIDTAWWWPAHLAVYEIPHEVTTIAQQVVPSSATVSGSVARGYVAGNADRSWGSLVDLAGRTNADGPDPGGRRCLFSWLHGCGLWLSPAVTVTTWRARVIPRDLLLPGVTTAKIRLAWVISCDTADMFLRWTDPATGISQTYTTTGLEAETMVTAPDLTISHPGGCELAHTVGWNVARGELAIHSAYLFESEQ
jgi:hypothetical protein